MTRRCRKQRRSKVRKIRGGLFGLFGTKDPKIYLVEENQEKKDDFGRWLKTVYDEEPATGRPATLTVWFHQPNVLVFDEGKVDNMHQKAIQIVITKGYNDALSWLESMNSSTFFQFCEKNVNESPFNCFFGLILPRVTEATIYQVSDLWYSQAKEINFSNLPINAEKLFSAKKSIHFLYYPILTQIHLDKTRLYLAGICKLYANGNLVVAPPIASPSQPDALSETLPQSQPYTSSTASSETLPQDSSETSLQDSSETSSQDEYSEVELRKPSGNTQPSWYSATRKVAVVDNEYNELGNPVENIQSTKIEKAKATEWPLARRVFPTENEENILNDAINSRTTIKPESNYVIMRSTKDPHTVANIVQRPPNKKSLFPNFIRRGGRNRKSLRNKHNRKRNQKRKSLHKKALHNMRFSCKK